MNMTKTPTRTAANPTKHKSELPLRITLASPTTTRLHPKERYFPHVPRELVAHLTTMFDAETNEEHIQDDFDLDLYEQEVRSEARFNTRFRFFAL